MKALSLEFVLGSCEKMEVFDFVFSYRSLNSVTIRPIYPVSNTKQLIDALKGSLFFSSIDFSKAYYQCPMKEEDKCKTAFTTRKGQFEFNRLPFGFVLCTCNFSEVDAHYTQ